MAFGDNYRKIFAVPSIARQRSGKNRFAPSSYERRTTGNNLFGSFAVVTPPTDPEYLQEQISTHPPRLTSGYGISTAVIHAYLQAKSPYYVVPQDMSEWPSTSMYLRHPESIDVLLQLAQIHNFEGIYSLTNEQRGLAIEIGFGLPVIDLYQQSGLNARLGTLYEEGQATDIVLGHHFVDVASGVKDSIEPKVATVCAPQYGESLAIPIFIPWQRRQDYPITGNAIEFYLQNGWLEPGVTRLMLQEVVQFNQNHPSVTEVTSSPNYAYPHTAAAEFFATALQV